MEPFTHACQIWNATGWRDHPSEEGHPLVLALLGELGEV